MTTPVPPVDAWPPLPSRANRAVFPAAAETWNQAEKDIFPQIVAVAENVKANADEALEAADQAAAAAAAAQLAAASAGAVLFNPLTPYDQYETAISGGNGRLYRRKTAGTSATDPSADAVNWELADVDLVDVIVTGTTHTLASGTRAILTNGSATTVTLPLSPDANTRGAIKAANGRTDNVINLNGQQFEDSAEATIVIDIKYAAVNLKFTNGKWRLV